MCRTCSRRQTELTDRKSEHLRYSKRCAKDFETNGMLTIAQADQISLNYVKILEAQKHLDQAQATCPDKS